MRAIVRIGRLIRFCKDLGYNSEAETIGGAYRSSAHSDSVLRKNIAVQQSGHNFGKRSINRMVKVLATLLTMAFISAAPLSAAPLKTTEVADGIYVFEGTHGLMNAENRGHIANIGFIVGDAAVAVVDTGGSLEEGKALLETIKSITPLPVRYVINTHMHPDHVFGNAAYLGPDVAFVGHARLNAALEARFDHYLAANGREMGAALVDGVTRVPVTIEVQEELALDLGGRTLRLRAWPVAHTDNDLTVFDERTATLFAGDLVFMEHLPSLDGSLRGWQRVITELAELPAERVVPGHGPASAPWPEALDPQRRYFDRLAADLRAAIDSGAPLSEAVKTAGRSEAGNWQLFDEFNARNATAAYAELEWE